MDIHKMTLEHVDEVYQLGKNERAFVIHQGHSFWTREQLSRWIEENQDVLLVAIDGGKIVGFALNQLHRPTGKATIENIFVKKGFRGGIVGRRLVMECLSRLKSLVAAQISGRGLRLSLYKREAST